MLDRLSRRQILIDRMSQINDLEQYTCSSCEGVCCTYLSNSMQITPIEALDIVEYLEKHNLLTTILIGKIEQSILDFRLDKEVQGLRRTYTCPFYNPGKEGCSLSRKVKPYGCLAFNPKIKNANNQSKCESDQLLLKDRESTEEENINKKLMESLKLSWNKLPIPVAIKEIIERDGMDTYH